MAMHYDDRVFLIDKPRGLTSFGAVRRLRRAARVKKAGHCGSLDPNATGLLVLVSGVATRLAGLFVDLPKEYEGRVRFGRATDSYDADGVVTTTASVPPLQLDAVAAVLRRFEGAIEQIPPMVSALKHGGRRLYELAREGKEVERSPRRVMVYALTLCDLGAEHADIRVRCGRGCYVRSLAHDIGAALGIPAHLESLRRTAVGPFGVSAATALADLEEALQAPRADGETALPAGVLSLPHALAAYPALVVRATFEAALLHGAQPESRFLVEMPRVSGPHRLLSADGKRLLAVADVEGKLQFARVRLQRVFPAPLAIEPEGGDPA